MSFIEQESPVEKVKKVATHPKVSTMVDEAIRTLAERNGSSFAAIKKFISANYNADGQKLSTHIKKCLKAGVERGDLVQTTGTGANGSFKINKKKVDAKLLKQVKLYVPSPNRNTRSKKSTKPQTRSKLYASTPQKTVKPKKRVVTSPTESPVKKMDDVDAQVDPTADATFIKPKAERAKKSKKMDDGDAQVDSTTGATFKKPKAERAKKPKVSLPTKPRKPLVPVPKKVKAKELSSRQSQVRQEKSTSPVKLEKTDAAMPTKAKKKSKYEKVASKKTAAKKREIQSANFQPS